MIISCWPPWYALLLYPSCFSNPHAKISESSEQLSAVGQSIAVGKQVSTGLGRHINTLTDSQIEEYQKASLSSSVGNFMSLIFNHRLDTPQNCFISSRFAFPNSLSCISSKQSPLERSVAEHKWPLWLWISFGPLYPWLPLPRSAPRLGLSYRINASIRSVFTFWWLSLREWAKIELAKTSNSRRSGTLSEP